MNPLQQTKLFKIDIMTEKKNNIMPDAFSEDKSPADFGTTVDRLSKEIESKTWKISNIYDLQETMKKHDKHVLPVKVFSLCHPKHSSLILEKDDERIVSSLMPCRISVYEKHDGKTYISRMNPTILASSFGGIIEKVMSESAAEVEEIIAKVLFIN